MSENDKFTPDAGLQGDTLLVRLIRAYKTANWGTALTPQAEQATACEFIRRYGPRAVDTAITWLNECEADNPGHRFFFGDASNGTLISAKTKGDHHDYEFLIRLLTEIGDERAVEPLLHHFPAQEAYGSGTARRIVDFSQASNPKRLRKALSSIWTPVPIRCWAQQHMALGCSRSTRHGTRYDLHSTAMVNA